MPVRTVDIEKLILNPNTKSMAIWKSNILDFITFMMMTLYKIINKEIKYKLSN